jgi:hypothetical protein
MTIRGEVRQEVRRRAGFACEFCGVEEVDVGSELTIDHFRPRSQGGSDALENLVYCCFSCNQFKSDYWPLSAGSPRLWNPRLNSRAHHFTETDNGVLEAITDVGFFTVQRLRLNRSALVAHRRRKREASQREAMLERQTELNRALVALLSVEEHLVAEQRQLLMMMLGRLR